MNPKLIEALKRKLVEKTGIQFGDYLGEGTYSVAFAARAGGVESAVKFSKQPVSNGSGTLKEQQALKHILEVNGHPHIVTLMDIWEIDDHLITRWERAEMSLEDRLAECRGEGLPGIPREELLTYIQQAAEALDFLHGRGKVHRDIKPANLLLFHGQVKLIDLGFARDADLTTKTATMLGTPAFMPPEAEDGVLKGGAVDIYCLAGTFLMLTTGHLPFTGNDRQQRASKRKGDFDRSGLHSELAEVLAGALHPDRDRRIYQTAGQLVDALATGSLSPQPVKTAAPAGISSAKSKNSSALDRLDRLQAVVQARQQATEIGMRQLCDDFRKTLHQQLDEEDFAFAFATAQRLRDLDGSDAELDKMIELLDSHKANDLGMEFTLVPPGRFLMGSPPDESERRSDEFQHPVNLTQPFYLAVHPVTVEQFRAFVAATEYRTEAEKAKDSNNWRNPGISQQWNHPVVQVTWNDAQVYCEWLSKRENKTFTLPTEAQWEYACRAGAAHYAAYCVGDGKTLSKDDANYGYDKGVGTTTAVGSYKANGWGLYDMPGNVWEWCADFYGDNYYHESPEDDPFCSAGSSRVLRGGCWGSSYASYCRSACRSSYEPSNHYYDVGFRLLRVY